MTRKQKRIKIAEATGWTEIHEFFNNNFEHPNDYRHEIRGKSPCGSVMELLEYFESLDAMHQTEGYAYKISRPGWASHYNAILVRITGNSRDAIQYNWSWHATAEERAEALGLSLELWKEGE